MQGVKTEKEQYRVKRYTVILMAVWTVTLAVLLTWDLSTHERHALIEAQSMAKAIFHNDLEYRRWNASLGGVYVPVTEQTPPNPYLSHIPDRDVTTTDGKHLTLMNPAYMTRQVHELMDEVEGGLRGHITSLDPVQPENRADAWETEALRAFEQGKPELSSIETMPDGKLYFRYMRPMITEKRCLKCHGDQGYKVGDIRGGISVSVPILLKADGLLGEATEAIVGHGLLWLIGLAGLIFGGRKQMGAIDAIQNSETRVRHLLESTAEAIYGLDLDGNCTFVNPSCLKLLGYESSDDVLGKNMHNLIHHTRPDGSPYPVHECQIYKSLKTGASTHVDDEVLWRKDGTSFASEYWSHPVLTGGKVSGLVVAFLDISERKQAEDTLRQRLDELERFRRATVQREFRIKELRDEIEQLKEDSKKEQP